MTHLWVRAEQRQNDRQGRVRHGVQRRLQAPQHGRREARRPVRPGARGLGHGLPHADPRPQPVLLLRHRRGRAADGRGRARARGAECVCIPETDTNAEDLVHELRAMQGRGKSSIMLIVAEGDERGGAHEIARLLDEAGNPFSSRVVILGHLQRGGSPVPMDRILAASMGDYAVRQIIAGETEMLSGIIGGQNRLTPFAEAVAGHNPIPERMLELLETLSH